MRVAVLEYRITRPGEKPSEAAWKPVPGFAVFFNNAAADVTDADLTHAREVKGKLERSYGNDPERREYRVMIYTRTEAA